MRPDDPFTGSEEHVWCRKELTTASGTNIYETTSIIEEFAFTKLNGAIPHHRFAFDFVPHGHTMFAA